MTFALILRHWKLVLCGIAVVSLAITATYYRIDRDRWKGIAQTLRIDLEEARARTEAEIATHRATKEAYRAAQAEAEAMEKARLQRVVTEQQRINDDVTEEYQRRLAAARAAAAKLRREAGAGKCVAGAPGNVPVPETPAAARRSDDPACQDGLSDADRLIATETAIRLESLQRWVREQTSVD